ncbi:DUF4225 domain-containing protein [Pseudomonas sp. H1h]|uniref:DUF4225 domain-containing protein n=1 Tax=Pseudomonas sp. H1h TaxID=1397280 RepID=UPI0004699AB5|nr:DUF4225 domain-containing protein [Pseudomonas sp. H1h]
MNEDSCDINDVTRAASELVAFGCQIGATQLYDSFSQLRFSEIVSSYANEIIRAVDEGVMSAKQGLKELREEHSDLLNKVSFYAQNGVGVAAGVMQLQIGAIQFSSKNPQGIFAGALYSAHGFNNVHEGVVNIYNGPETQSTVGPIRKFYQFAVNDTHIGNTAYYSADLLLSGLGMLRHVRKPGSTQLFNHDPINYERSYNQMGSLALALELLIDSITVKNIDKEMDSRTKK